MPLFAIDYETLKRENKDDTYPEGEALTDKFDAIKCSSQMKNIGSIFRTA
jgi:hypothetical protein